LPFGATTHKEEINMNQEAVAELFHGIKGYRTLVKIPKTIDIDVDAHCNVSHNFNHPFDLFHEEYADILPRLKFVGFYG
jgi:hypothetical protein